MRFLSWNVGCGASGYHCPDPAGIAQFIREQNIDFCCLQEVDRFARRTKFADLPDFWAQISGLYSFFLPSVTAAPEQAGMPAREYGNCLLSRYPLREAFCIRFNEVEIPQDAHVWESEVRSALFGSVDIEGINLWVVASHFAYSPDFGFSCVRQQQAALLAGLLVDKQRVLLGADLNTYADGQDILPLKETLEIQTAAIGPTWPLGGDLAAGRAPFIDIDHIFSRGVKSSRAQKIDLPALTDHSAVIVDFTF